MIILAKNRASYYQQLAQLYHKLGQTDQAYTLLEQAVNVALSSEQLQLAGELQLELATLYLTSGALAEAYRATTLFLAWFPTDPNGLQNMLAIMGAMKKWSMAIEFLQNDLLNHALIDHTWGLHLLGVFYWQADQIDQAIEIFKGLLKIDSQAIEPRYHLALGYEKKQKYRMAQQEVNRVLRRQRSHQAARELYNRLSDRKKERSKQRRAENKAQNKTNQRFKALKVEDFLQALEIDEEVNKLAQYLTIRYWKERDGRGKNPQISFRGLVMVMVVQGIKEWKLSQLKDALKEEEEQGLRLALGFGPSVDQLPTYQALSARIRGLGVFPLKYLSRKMSRRAVERNYVKLDEVIMDTSLIAASCDLFRFNAKSPTSYSEPSGAWSYPKYGKRIFGFKLALVTNAEGDILDVAVSPANISDITSAKEAIKRLSQTLAGCTIGYLLADSGYCSKSLRQLAISSLGCCPGSTTVEGGAGKFYRI